MQDPRKGYRSIALRGALAIGIAQALKIVLQLGSMVALSRFLAPVDFGVIAMVAPVVAFAVVMQDLGFQQAMIQAADLSPEQINKIFWLNLTLSFFIAISILLMGPLCGALYDDKRVVVVTMCWAIPVFITAFGSHHLGLLNRTLRFRALAFIDVAVAVATFLAAITAALWLQNYWALVVSAVVGSIVMAALAAYATKWRPQKPWVPANTHDLRRFALNLTGSNLLTFLSRNIDNVIVAKAFGAQQLGYYDLSYRLLLTPITQVNAPIGRVVQPILGRFRAEPIRYRDSYVLAAAFATWISVPGVSALAIVAHDFVPTLLGPDWTSAASIFGWLGLAAVCQPLSNTTGWLFLTQNRTREMFRWSLFSTATTIASFVVGVPWGPAGIAASYGLSSLFLRMPVLLHVVGRTGPVTTLDLVRLQAPVTASCLLSWAAVRMLEYQFALCELPVIATSLALSYFFAGAAVVATGGNRREISRMVALAAGRFRGGHSAARGKG